MNSLKANLKTFKSVIKHLKPKKMQKFVVSKVVSKGQTFREARIFLNYFITIKLISILMVAEKNFN